MKKLLTVIIPTYNMENYISGCLESLVTIGAGRDISDIEILVVNDGSKDNSSAIAHDYESRYNGIIRVIDKENGNYGSCVNRGISEAAGKYVKILDADDTFIPSGFAEYLDELRGNNAELIVNDYVTVDAAGSVTGSFTFPLPRRQAFPLSGLQQIIPLHAIAYRTDILRRIGYRQTEGISYTDQEWIFWPLIAVEKIYYIPVNVYSYLLGREGQTCERSVWMRSQKQAAVVMASKVNIYNSVKAAISPEAKGLLERDVCKTFVDMFRNCYFLGVEDIYGQLVETDKKIQETDKQLARLIGERRLIPFIPIRIIEQWRRNGRPKRLPLYVVCLIRLYNLGVAVSNSMCK